MGLPDTGEVVALEEPNTAGGPRAGMDGDTRRVPHRHSAFDVTLTSQLVSRLFAYLPNVLAAVVVLAAGSIIARFLARSVLIGAVNMNLQYARLLSAGVKWLVTVLAVAMALEHLGIGGDIIRLAFAILFGGIVLALALAVGLGSKELVSRSLDREVSKTSSQNVREPVGHL